MAPPLGRRALCSASIPARRTLILHASPATTSLRRALPGPSSQNNHSSPSAPLRPFTTTRSLPAGVRSKPNIRQRAMPSSSILLAEAQKAAHASGEIPEGVGLLPAHFVPPTPFSKTLTTLLRTPRKLWVVFKKWGFTRWQQQMSVIQMKWYSGAFLKHRSQKRELPGMAMELYRDMYEGFARGDVGGGTLGDRLCEGLKGSLARRIHVRGGEMLRWKLVKEVEKPRLVSYICAVVPAPQGQKLEKGKVNAITQAVVRIRTLQAIGKTKSVMRREKGRVITVKVPVDSEGRELEQGSDADLTEKNAKEMVEYFVMQQIVKKGSPGPWKAWGMTNEADVEALVQEHDRAKALRRQTKSAKDEKTGKSNVLT